MNIKLRSAPNSRNESLFELMFEETGDYLEQSLSILDLNREQFKSSFKSIGEKTEVFVNNEFAGFFWTELRNKILHLHALIILEKFRNKGIGSYILHHLENTAKASKIELGVHKSNEMAKKLYYRKGYTIVRKYEKIQYCILQKEIK